MKEQLSKTWNLHQQMNELLLQNIPETALDKTLSTRGGRTIRQQFIHIHQTRLKWLEVCAKDLFKKQQPLDKTEKVSKQNLLRALSESTTGLLELFDRSWENDGMIKGFKSGLLSMLGYFISHESHHRGNILLTLKQSGEKIPENVKWGLWEWDR